MSESGSLHVYDGGHISVRDSMTPIEQIEHAVKSSDDAAAACRKEADRLIARAVEQEAMAARIEAEADEWRSILERATQEPVKVNLTCQHQVSPEYAVHEIQDRINKALGDLDSLGV